jgi:hypothetical protein
VPTRSGRRSVQGQTCPQLNQVESPSDGAAAGRATRQVISGGTAGDGKDIMIKDFNVSERGHGSYWLLGILRWVRQSRPSCARRAGIAHSARQEGRRHRLRRRAIDSVPFSSLATGRVSRFWSALRTDELSEIARVADRMRGGRWKVFKGQNDAWLEEYRLYHRDADGRGRRKR